ncbi:hypothetical protein F7734_09380 [Scytonema sp. UIC 10036]|uniref:hypothetical protein n=1 Tax=Scytonema sp. UIC 10036 TaxID=2304196 RepID=UPI0012DADDAE|nr:hypothetical protein [Scytonema sp. UIC 10036]MUG92653.1 hypothetical protein [Scytonema sp. UIC 10036]
MVWPVSDDAVQQLGENIWLYDLAQIRGTNAILNRIPSLTGVYAWYRRFQLEQSVAENPELFMI